MPRVHLNANWWAVINCGEEQQKAEQVSGGEEERQE